MARRVFIVTGANKGIGFEVVKGLCHQLKGPIDNSQAVVVLTSRSVDNGKAALEKLQAEGLKAEMLQLDISDGPSRDKFISEVKNKYGSVECLVNNAGFAFHRTATEGPDVQSRVTCGINYTGTKAFTIGMLPLLAANSRIVNVASIMGQQALKEMSPENMKRLMSKTTKLEEIDEVVSQFVADMQVGKAAGWPTTSYGMSKAAVIAMTAAMARMADEGTLVPGVQGIISTSCCPGWCKTDMGGWEQPPLTAQDGASVVLPLALGADRKVHGMFVQKSGVEDLSVSV